MSNSHVTPTFGEILATFIQRIPARISHKPPGECEYCDKHAKSSMMPPHDASKNCESGKRPHCTCDVCF